MKWKHGNHKKKKKKCYHWSNFNFLFLYELYRKDKNIVPFHQCQLSVVCVDFEREKAKTQSFRNRYICHLAELLGKNVWDRFVIAPFVYSTCKMSIPDGNYSISTFFFFLSQRTMLIKWLCCLPCTEYHILRYSVYCRLYTLRCKENVFVFITLCNSWSWCVAVEKG